MFKIASCIFIAAVCLQINFQQVVAASLPNPLGSFGSLGPLGSLLDNAQNKISDTQDKLRDVIEGGKQNIGDKMTDLDSLLSDQMQKLKDKTEQILKEAQNTDVPPCSRLYDRTRIALATLFQSCVSDKMQNVEEIYKDLMGIITELQQILMEQVQDVKQCFEDPSTKISCLNEKQDVLFSRGVTMMTKIPIGISKAMQLTLIISSVKPCMQKTMAFDIIPKNIFGFPQDVKACIESKINL